MCPRPGGGGMGRGRIPGPIESVKHKTHWRRNTNAGGSRPLCRHTWRVVYMAMVSFPPALMMMLLQFGSQECDSRDAKLERRAASTKTTSYPRASSLGLRGKTSAPVRSALQQARALETQKTHRRLPKVSKSLTKGTTDERPGPAPISFGRGGGGIPPHPKSPTPPLRAPPSL